MAIMADAFGIAEARGVTELIRRFEWGQQRQHAPRAANRLIGCRYDLAFLALEPLV